jgi:cytochrome c biogenesis protein CcmG/thiol:disulfide interchange protein DsbE
MKKNLIVAVLTVAAVALVLVADRSGWLERVAPATGEATEGYTITDLNGELIDLTPYRGKVVLLNYWATWCTPCLIEMPWFIDFQKQYGERGFQVIGVSLDDEGRAVVEPWLREQKFELDGRPVALNYPIWIGNEKASQQYFAVFGLPTTLVFSREGKLLKTFVGITSHEKFVAAIEGALQQEVASTP